jgi:hypothetical protein
MLKISDPILIAFIALLASFLFHVVVCQFRYNSEQAVFLLLVVFSCGYSMVVFFLSYAMHIDLFSHVWVSLPIHSFATMLYYHLYTSVDRSVSIRIMGEMLDAPGGKLNLVDIERIYSKEQMVRSRLDLLVESNFLGYSNNNYYCKPKAALIAQCAILIKRMYALKETG